MHFLFLIILLHLHLDNTTSSSRNSLVLSGTSCNSLSGCLPIPSYRPKLQQPKAKEGRLSALGKANTWSPIGNLKVTLNDRKNKSKVHFSYKFNNLNARNAGVTVYAKNYLLDSSAADRQNTAVRPWLIRQSYQPITVATPSDSDFKKLAISKNDNIAYKSINTLNERNEKVSFSKQNINSNSKKKSTKNTDFKNSNQNEVKRIFPYARFQTYGNPKGDPKYNRKQIVGAESIINVSNGYPDKKSFDNIVKGYHRKRIGSVDNKEKDNIRDFKYDINFDQFNDNDSIFHNQKRVQQQNVAKNEKRSNSKVLNRTINPIVYFLKLFNIAERLFYIPQLESRQKSYDTLNLLSQSYANGLGSRLYAFTCKIIQCQKSNVINLNKLKYSRTDQLANEVGSQVLRSLDSDESSVYFENNSDTLSIISPISFKERKRNKSRDVSVPVDSLDKISAINESSESNQTALKESDEFTPAGSLKPRTESRENDLIPEDLAKKRKKSALQIYSQDPHDKRPGILKRKNAAILQLNFDIRVPKVRGENVYFRLKFPEESLRKSQDQSERNAGDVNYKKAAVLNKNNLTSVKEKANDTTAPESNRWLEINKETANSTEKEANSVFKINEATRWIRMFLMPLLRNPLSSFFPLYNSKSIEQHVINTSQDLNVNSGGNSETTEAEQNPKQLLNRKRRSYIYYPHEKKFKPFNRPNIHYDYTQKHLGYRINGQHVRQEPIPRFSKSSDTNYLKHYSHTIDTVPQKFPQKIPSSYTHSDSYTPRILSNTQTFSPRESREYRGYMNKFNGYDVEASETLPQASRRGSLKSIIDKDITPLINSINNNVSNHTNNAQHIIHWYFIIPNQANGDSFFIWKNTSTPPDNTLVEDSPSSALRSSILTATAQPSENGTSTENMTIANTTGSSNTSMENGKLIWNSTEYDYDDDIWHKDQWTYVTPPTWPDGTVLTTKSPKTPSKWPWDIVHHHHHHKHSKYPRKTWPWPETVSCTCNKWQVPSRGWWPSRTTPMMPGVNGWDKK